MSKRYSDKKYVDVMDLNDDDDIKNNKKKTGNKFFVPIDDDEDDDDIELNFDEVTLDDDENLILSKKSQDNTHKSTGNKKSTSKNKASKKVKSAGSAVAAKDLRVYKGIIAFFIVIFSLLCAYFVFFVAVKSKDFASNPYNPRLNSMSKQITRGSIYSADGQVLAETKVSDSGTETRVYPYGREYAHAVGYSVNGMAGVELSENYTLLSSSINTIDKTKASVTGEKLPGDSVVTTLDTSLQDAAYHGMGDYYGAAIAIDPDTGKILMMVSNPDFDPNTISENWETLTGSDSSVLVNRATQGLYPPGSTFKILTALEYLDEGQDTEAVYRCKGKLKVGDYTIHCAGNEVHGKQTIKEAFANSCNCFFANAGLELNDSEFSSLADKLLFNQKLPTKLKNTSKSRFSIKSSDTDSKKMQLSIGQSDTVVTPLHMCMISSAIAADGTLYEPYIVDHVQNADGNLVKQYSPETYKKLLSDTQVSEIRDYMRYTVTNGTARKLNSDAYDAYGKTGTAEYTEDKSKTHSWFTGFAEKDGKKLAIAVIMEGAGSSSKHAVPLAKEIFDTYFNE